jgi:catechol 2,3-dioxygenase-like lactoylglutathione lyase family enzyme
MPAWWLRSVLLEVSDAGRALDWYTQILGFGVPKAEELPYNSGLVTVRPPGSRLLVQLREKPHPHPKETGLTFLVEDVEGVVSDLESKNVRISQRPTWQEWGTTARFSDPDGNEIEICSNT